MSIFVFALAALLSLPKQFVTVYLGVLIDGSGCAFRAPFPPVAR
jgi:hypothetical protein